MHELTHRLQSPFFFFFFFFKNDDHRALYSRTRAAAIATAAAPVWSFLELEGGTLIAAANHLRSRRRSADIDCMRYLTTSIHVRYRKHS
jgi:hypothetical protein